MLDLALIYYPGYFNENYAAKEEVLEDAKRRVEKNIDLLERYTTSEEREDLQRKINEVFLEFREKK